MTALELALTLIAAAVATLASAHALLHKRRPQSAFGWIAVCYTLPFLGPLLYYAFGINRVELRAKRLRAGETLDAEAAAASGVRGLPPQLPGNRVEPLYNGEAAFPAMLDAIRAARRRVYFSSYIFNPSGIGAEFATELAAAAARGVAVRVLVDGVGELYSLPRAGTVLRRRGVPLARFLPPRLFPPALRVNLRNHRKILICDDTAAFFGGLNIDSRHMAGDERIAERIVDLHFRLQGPAVADLAAVFASDWRFAAGEELDLSAPVSPPDGSARCRTVRDGPDQPFDRVTSLLLAAVGGARRRVAIMTPYFLPPRELMGVLQSAALRGLNVAVLLPGKNNLPYVHWAVRKTLWELLEHGVRIYYQPPPFVHSKLLLVDDDCAIVGSGNLDPRSLRLNFELAVEIADRELVGRLGEHFAAARARSEPISLANVDGRRLPTRLLDGLAWLFSPYL